MKAELRLICAAALPLIVTATCTPQAIRLALRTEFFDRPIGYKQHSAPTPYLGGLAVMAGFLAGILAFGGALGTYASVAIGALVLWGVGTIDDRRNLGPGIRVLATAAVALLVTAFDIRWHFLANDVADAALTVVWIVALVNAFNLMDNQDGACATVAATSALCAATIAILDENLVVATLGVALAGACLGFLRWNLSRPARIFLGDGGSMPLGFAVAVIALAGPGAVGIDWSPVVIAALVVGLVIFDTSLVIFSRLRRGAPLLTGGRDHVTHRLLGPLKSTRRVAVALALAQAALGGTAVAVTRVDDATLAIAAGVGWMVVGVVSLCAFEWAWMRSEPFPPQPLEEAASRTGAR